MRRRKSKPMNSRLAEEVHQSGSIRVTRGGKEITLSDLNASNEWRDLPGETVLHEVRMLNRESVNGVIYEDTGVRDVTRIHNAHHVAWEHEDSHNDARPARSRFGRTFNSRNVEKDGEAIGTVADVGIYEGDRSAADEMVVKALRNPSSIMFSIESAPGTWDGYADDKGIIHVTGVKKMRDTCAVTYGGTTSGLQENDRRKRKVKRAMSNTERQRLIERERTLEADVKRLQEECSCAKKEATDKDAQIASLQAELEKEKELRQKLEATAQENDRRANVRAKADELGVTLKETQINRYARFDEAELDEQLSELAELQEAGEPVPTRQAGAKRLKENDNTFDDNDIFAGVSDFGFRF